MKTITLREVPDELHRKVKATAAMEGIALKDLVLKVLKEYVEKKGR